VRSAPAPSNPVPSGLAHPVLRRLRDAMTSIAHGALALDGGAMDAALGGGLALGALHEITAQGIEAEFAASPAAFLAALLARLPTGRPIFWVALLGDLYPPGLIAFGLDPARLIQLRATSDDEALAIAETLLRAGVATAVVAEIGRAGPLAGRRLQLACLGRGTTGFVLRRFPHGARASEPLTAAVTRWRIAPATSTPVLRAPGGARWQVELQHARGGVPGAWIVQQEERPNATHPFRLAAALADPPPDIERRLAGGDPTRHGGGMARPAPYRSRLG
jgi:protein ImuA